MGRERAEEKQQRSKEALETWSITEQWEQQQIFWYKDNTIVFIVNYVQWLLW